MLSLVVHVASATDAIDDAFDKVPRPWPVTAGSFVDSALEHAHHALDDAVFAALESGVTIEQIETAIGHAVVKPEWFDDQ